MNPQRFQRAMELFQELCDLPSDERAARLDTVCASDPQLRSEVEALLEHDRDATQRIRVDELGGAPLRLAEDVIGSMPRQREQDQPMPASIGRYRVVRRIGEGGMGTVYEAEQESPRRTVAIKVLRTGAATSSLKRRFEHEAFILGRLQHPGIAQIIEAGRAASGADEQLFLVMELIRGDDIITYCNKHDLDHRQRLALFMRVCDAVQHAHQKGVIHRDLKPANILVCDETGSAHTSSDSHLLAPGQPKILDFGVARLTDADLNVTTMQTGVGQLIGTIPYMSPEQVGGEADEVDTRSDIYSLGVVLHELLTGKLPHDVRNRSMLEAARVIRTEAPRRLSTISRRFRGDLDTIVMKSLEKEKERRYQSAAELAADVNAYLANEPIAAKRDSRWYVLQKVAWRYKVATGFAAALLILITGSAVALGVLYERAKAAAALASAERDRATLAEAAAKAEAGRLQRVTSFMRNIIHAADARALGREVKVVDALDYAADKVYEDFGSDPETKTGVLFALSQTYNDLAMFPQAEKAVNEAVRLLREQYPQGSESLAAVLNQQGVIYTSIAKLPEAAQAFEEALAMHRQYSQDPLKQAWDLGNLASAYRVMGKLDRAEQYMHECLQLRRAAAPRDAEEWRELATALAAYSSILYSRGNYDAAAEQAAQSIEIYRKMVSGSAVREGVHLAAALNNLAAIENERGNLDASRKLYQECLELIVSIRGPEHPEVSNALVNMAQFERSHGDLKRSEDLYQQSLAQRRKLLPPGHPELGHPLTGLGAIYMKTGRVQEAEQALREAYEVRSGGKAPPSSLAFTATALGSCLLMQKKYDEAEPLLLEGFQLHTRARGPRHKATLEAAEHVHNLYRETGQLERLAAFQAASQPAASLAEQPTSPASSPASQTVAAK